MALIPDKVVEKIQYCENHIAPFTANAVAIGTSSAAVTDLQTKTAAARAAYDAQQAAKQAAEAKTNELHVALLPMVDAMADILKQIKAKAASSGDGIYTLAEITPPAPPAPVSTLGKPASFKVTLSESGALELKWKCTNPRSATGTIYQIFRRIGPGGEFAYIGGTGAKDFIDATVPAGASQVTYQIQAVRSTAVGPWAQFNVNFGVSSGGGMTVASVSEAPPTPPAKIAA